MKLIIYTPGQTCYSVLKNRSSPFFSRKISVFPPKGIIHGRRIDLEQAIYKVRFKNQAGAYLKRDITNKYITHESPTFLDPSKLKGNLAQVTFYMHEYAKRCIHHLKMTPSDLFHITKELEDLCLKLDYPIPEIKAYKQLSYWEQFITLLENIRDYQGEFSFDLFASAMIQYRNACLKS